MINYGKKSISGHETKQYFMEIQPRVSLTLLRPAFESMIFFFSKMGYVRFPGGYDDYTPVN